MAGGGFRHALRIEGFPSKAVFPRRAFPSYRSRYLGNVDISASIKCPMIIVCKATFLPKPSSFPPFLTKMYRLGGIERQRCVFITAVGATQRPSPKSDESLLALRYFGTQLPLEITPREERSSDDEILQ